MEDAAARLLAGLDARAEKRRLAGGLKGPAEITESKNACPCVFLEKEARGEARQGEDALQASGQYATGREEVGGSDHTVERGGNNGGFESGGRATREASEPRLEGITTDCARPTPDDIGCVDRAVTRSGGLEFSHDSQPHRSPE